MAGEEEYNAPVVELAGGTVEAEGDDISKLAGLLSGEPDGKDKDSTGDSPAPDDDAPPDKAASGEGNGDEQDDDPAIEAPASWDAEAKARFAKLDSETQQFLLSRETDREKGVNAKLQEAAESRKKADAEVEQNRQIRSAYEQRLNAFAAQLNATVPDEFKDIKSRADLYNLAQKDPAKAERFRAYADMVTGVVSELAQIDAAKKAEAAESHKAFLAKEYDAISSVWPDFVDQSKGPAIRSEITQYAKERGFNDAEISGLADHRLVLVLRDAMEGRKAVKALEKAKGKADRAPPAKVTKPGQGDRVGKGNGLDRASLLTAARSGNTDRQVDAIARLLEG